ncbi:hypothetical protein [Bradyrhizobium sp. LMG 9283]|uniref:hypothetical protein n=1 Tax=Bradyrhizobium sp. LMG 9283 TaxID=592064 RepID=UPI00388DCE4E
MHWIDPACLPEVEGTFERFIPNPHGEVDGFIMKPDGRTAILVHTPPHLESELTRYLSSGDAVRVRGLRPRRADLLAAVAITSSGGRQIIDEGPEPDRKRPKLKHQPMAAEGSVRVSLFGPKGELRGALLSDGVVLRIGPKEAERAAPLLAPGAKVAARGDGAETRHGRVIEVLEIGPGLHALKPVKKPKPKGKPKPDAEARAA